MAPSGRWGIETTDKDLEIVRSQGHHMCCGVFDESDRIIRSSFCTGRIKPKDLYCRNTKAPREVLFLLARGPVTWPTCLPCVLNVYGAALSGDPIDRLLAVMEPLTEEDRQNAAQRLSELVAEIAAA